MFPVEVRGRQGYAGDVTNDVREVSRRQTHTDIQGEGQRVGGEQRRRKKEGGEVPEMCDW